MISWDKMKSDGMLEKLQRVWVKDMFLCGVAGFCSRVYVWLMLPGVFAAAGEAMLSNSVMGYFASVIYGVIAALPVCYLVVKWLSLIPGRILDGEWAPWMVAPVIVYDMALFAAGTALGSSLIT